MTTEQIERPTTALTLPQRAAVALGTAEHEKKLILLVEESKTIVEIKNTDGRTQCHAAYMRLKNSRVAIDKNADAATEDAKAFTKAIKTEKERLIALMSAEEDRLQAIRDKWDADREAEKLAKIEAERARVEGIRNRIDAMRRLPSEAIGMTSDAIASKAAELRLMNLGDEFAEFTDEARAGLLAAIDQLTQMSIKKAEQEAEAARLIAEREELARLRTEAEQRREEQEMEDALIISFQRAATRIEFDSVPYIKKASLQYESTGGDWENDPRPRVVAAFLAGRAYLKDRLEAAEKRAAEDAALKAERQKQETELAAQRAEAARQQAERDAEAARQAQAAKEAQEAAQAKLDAERTELERERAEIADAKRKQEEAEAARITAIAKAEAEEAERVRLQEAADQMLSDAKPEVKPAPWPFASSEELQRAIEQRTPSRPDDEEIIKVIADHFNVQANIAYGWLLELSKEIEYQ